MTDDPFKTWVAEEVARLSRELDETATLEAVAEAESLIARIMGKETQ